MIIGILGAGQLGKMLALAGQRLGMHFVFYDRSPDPCAASLGRVYKSFPAFSRAADLYTYEFENVPVHLAARLAAKGVLFPSLAALATAANRKKEKQFFTELGIEVVKWVEVSNIEELEEAAVQLGFPFVVKTIQLGYDGKGQTIIRSKDQLTRMARQLLNSSNYIAEKLVEIKREISLIAARARDGEVVYYPPVVNVHRQGILYSSCAPAQLSSVWHQRLKGWVADILQRLDYIGVIAVEFFETERGLVANEIAPRVHNSGHWTIEGASCCQFTNHIRAIAGLPLAKPILRGHSKMFNLVGRIPEGLAKQELLSRPDSHLHIYGKQARAGRKLGHFTLVTPKRPDHQIMKDHKFFVLPKGLA